MAEGDAPQWRGVLDISTKKGPKKCQVTLGSFTFTLNDERDKVLHTQHLLDIAEINHPDASTCVISLRNKDPIGLSGPLCHEFVSSLLRGYDHVFFGLPASSQLVRRVRADLQSQPLDMRPTKRMDGFTDLYRAYCAQLKINARMDIVWDV
jgi:hypothetical protein